MIIIGAEIVNKPLNGSVAFVKDKDVYITNDYWRIVVNFDFTQYEDVITQLRTDVLEFQETVKHTAIVGELQQVKLTLNSLEGKLRNLIEFLPKAERRRGLINAGGAVLKAVFGV